MGLLPGISADGRRLVAARAIRSLGNGFASVALAAYLHERGFGAFEVGLLATVALSGTALATVLVGIYVDRIGRRRTLQLATVVVMGSGVAFALAGPYWLLLVIAFAGTLNPSMGDVSVFLPIEQTALAETTTADRRTWLYARYSLFGSLAAALGALGSGFSGVLAGTFGWELEFAQRVMFAGYGVLGLAMLFVYRPLTPAIELVAAGDPTPRTRATLHESRGIVYRLSGLFAVDSFGGGLVVQSVLALWLLDAHGLSVETTGAIFFIVGTLSAASMLLAAPLAARIGLIQTMAYTHLPANVALMLVPVVPTLWLALPLLFVRAALSQMDVPPRTAYIVSVVTPRERAAAAGVTNVARSLSSAAGPAVGGALLAAGPWGLPLLVGGGVKAAYDLALLHLFRRVPVRDESRESSAVDD